MLIYSITVIDNFCNNFPNYEEFIFSFSYFESHERFSIVTLIFLEELKGANLKSVNTINEGNYFGSRNSQKNVCLENIVSEKNKSRVEHEVKVKTATENFSISETKVSKGTLHKEV